MTRLAPHFADELQAAGLLTLPFAWGEDGRITFDPAMPQAQRDAVLAVYAAHNPDDAGKAGLRAERQRAQAFDGSFVDKAIALWVAGKLGIPPATARTEILTILRGLQ